MSLNKNILRLEEKRSPEHAAPADGRGTAYERKHRPRDEGWTTLRSTAKR